MVKLVFCESHGVYELIVSIEPGSLKVTSLNEQDSGPHHFFPQDHSFIHKGPPEACKECQ